LLTLFELLPHARPVVGQRLRHQHRNGLADRLGGRVSEELLGTCAPARDNTVQVEADDRVLRGFDEQHGGTIEVNSREGEFTEFTIRLSRYYGPMITEAAS
jgi:hypothetical protein